MIATLSSFNHVLTLPALPVVQVVLKKVHFVLVALSRMLRKHALLTKHLPTFLTLRVHSLNQLQDAVFTLFVGTHPQVGVLRCQIEGMHFLVLFADVLGQVVLVEVGISVENQVATFLRANNFLEHADFVDDIMLEAGVTEDVVTLGDFGLFFDFILALADSANESFNNFFSDHATDFSFIHIRSPANRVFHDGRLEGGRYFFPFDR